MLEQIDLATCFSACNLSIQLLLCFFGIQLSNKWSVKVICRFDRLRTADSKSKNHTSNGIAIATDWLPTHLIT